MISKGKKTIVEYTDLKTGEIITEFYKDKAMSRNLLSSQHAGEGPLKSVLGEYQALLDDVRNCNGKKRRVRLAHAR